jgi:long-subunit acyl-CoA synthetase (AMP-forming)
MHSRTGDLDHHDRQHRALGHDVTRGEDVSSLCRAFQDTVTRIPDRIALRTFGGAREVSWREYGREVSRLAATLRNLGVARGDSVALMMANRIEFHFLDVAIMHLGAVPVSIYNTLRPSEIAFILANSGARVAFAEAAYVQALHEANAAQRLLDQIVVIDGCTEGALALTDVLADESGFDITAAADSVRPEDIATVSYTSGTTGAPKGVELSHRSVLRSIRAIDEVYGTRDEARMVSFLPMAHVAERMFSHWRGIVHGFTVTPCPHPSEAGPYLIDVRPHYVFSPPRLFEKLRAAIEVGFDQETDSGRRTTVAEALRIGADVVAHDQSGEKVPADLRQRYEHLQRDVLAPALARVGWTRWTSRSPARPRCHRNWSGNSSSLGCRSTRGGACLR